MRSRAEGWGGRERRPRKYTERRRRCAVRKQRGKGEGREGGWGAWGSVMGRRTKLVPSPCDTLRDPEPALQESLGTGGEAKGGSPRPHLIHRRGLV